MTTVLQYVPKRPRGGRCSRGCAKTERGDVSEPGSGGAVVRLRVNEQNNGPHKGKGSKSTVLDFFAWYRYQG